VPESGDHRQLWTLRRGSMLALVAALWMSVTIVSYAAIFKAGSTERATSVTAPLTHESGPAASSLQTAPPIANTSNPSPAPPFSLARSDVTLNFAEATGGCPGFGNGPLTATIAASGGTLSISMPARPGVPARTLTGPIDSAGYLKVGSTDPTERFEGQIRQGALTSRYEITLGSCTESYSVTAQLP
jgi:hypothetical protein